MKAVQAVITEPFKADLREVELPDPGAGQIMVSAKVSAISAGTELAVYTGTHQWLKDPNLPDWKFPFRSGYSAAGVVVKVGKDIQGIKEGDRVSFPGNHASHEILSVTHERGKWWKMPDNLDFEKAAVACIARYGMGASIRAGITLGRSAAVLGLGIIGQFALRCLMAAGANPVVGIDAVPMRRKAALAAGAFAAIDPPMAQSRIKFAIPFVVERKLWQMPRGFLMRFPRQCHLLAMGDRWWWLAALEEKPRMSIFTMICTEGTSKLPGLMETCCLNLRTFGCQEIGTSTKRSIGCWHRLLTED